MKERFWENRIWWEWKMQIEAEDDKECSWERKKSWKKIQIIVKEFQTENKRMQRLKCESICLSYWQTDNTLQIIVSRAVTLVMKTKKKEPFIPSNLEMNPAAMVY